MSAVVRSVLGEFWTWWRGPENWITNADARENNNDGFVGYMKSCQCEVVHSKRVILTVEIRCLKIRVFNFTTKHYFILSPIYFLLINAIMQSAVCYAAILEFYLSGLRLPCILLTYSP